MYISKYVFKSKQINLFSLFLDFSEPTFSIFSFDLTAWARI